MVCSIREREASLYRVVEDAVVTDMAMVGVVLRAVKGQGDGGVLLRVYGDAVEQGGASGDALHRCRSVRVCASGRRTVTGRRRRLGQLGCGVV